jgi:hypothetical protein
VDKRYSLLLTVLAKGNQSLLHRWRPSIQVNHVLVPQGAPWPLYLIHHAKPIRSTQNVMSFDQPGWMPPLTSTK